MEALDLEVCSRPRYPFHPRWRGRPRCDPASGFLARQLDGVKGLVVLGHAGEGTFLTADEQARGDSQASSSRPTDACRSSPGSRWKVRRSPREEAKRAVEAGADGRSSVSVSRLAALRLSEGCAARPLPGDLPGKRSAADPVPVSGRHQGDVQPGNPARDRRAARRIRHEERRAQHAPMGHRDPGRSAASVPTCRSSPATTSTCCTRCSTWTARSSATAVSRPSR